MKLLLKIIYTCVILTSINSCCAYCGICNGFSASPAELTDKFITGKICLIQKDTILVGNDIIVKDDTIPINDVKVIIKYSRYEHNADCSDTFTKIDTIYTDIEGKFDHAKHYYNSCNYFISYEKDDYESYTSSIQACPENLSNKIWILKKKP